MADIKFLLFGTGDYYERYKKWFNKEDVLALMDNAEDKQGTFMDGIKVVSPGQGVLMDYDMVVILSFYIKDMRQQLIDMGVPEEKIIGFYGLHKVIPAECMTRPVRWFGSGFDTTGQGDRKRVLLLSHDMTLGGPAIALLHMAEVLARHGCQVLYASMIDGPLREKLLEEHIPVVVDENMQVGTMRDCGWIRDFSLIVCNTVSFHVFLSERDTGVPVIWWLHDSLFFYDGVDQRLLRDMDHTNLKVVSVGPVPEAAMHTILPDLPIGQLLYGVSDTCVGGGSRQEGGEGVVFVTIGYVEWRKGQDILVNAVKMLPVDVRQKAVFYLVGQDSSVMALRLKEETRDMPEIRIVGTLNRAGIDEMLCRADVLVCPSREDPMPTAAAEAMMHGVPCILSDAVGTAEFVADGVDGLIFCGENIHELAKKIEWCVSHRGMLAKMGMNARKIYERIFSVDAFESSLMRLICTAKLKR